MLTPSTSRMSADNNVAKRQNQQQALRLRQKALSHLEKYSCGPSLRETNSAKGLENSSFAETSGDNTLFAIAQRKANSFTSSYGHEEMTENDIYHIPLNNKSPIALSLPQYWRETRDPSSGELYWWHELSEKTTWDRPVQLSGSQILPNGWTAFVQAGTDKKYYWNEHTDQIQYDLPHNNSVSIAEAIKAKSKLDKILDSRFTAKRDVERDRTEMKKPRLAKTEFDEK